MTGRSRYRQLNHRVKCNFWKPLLCLCCDAVRLKKCHEKFLPRQWIASCICQPRLYRQHSQNRQHSQTSRATATPALFTPPLREVGLFQNLCLVKDSRARGDHWEAFARKSIAYSTTLALARGAHRSAARFSIWTRFEEAVLGHSSAASPCPMALSSIRLTLASRKAS